MHSCLSQHEGTERTLLSGSERRLVSSRSVSFVVPPLGGIGGSVFRLKAVLQTIRYGVVVVFIAASLSPAFAQQKLDSFAIPLAQPNTALINDLSLPDRANDEVLAIAAKAFRSFLDVEFDEIKNCCELSQGQLANLETAATVAVENSIDAWIEESGRIKEASDVVLDTNDSPKPLKTKLTAKLRAFHRRQVTNDRVWMNAIDGILTDVQKRKLSLARTGRANFSRKATAFQIAALLDTELHLNGEQRANILKVLIHGEAVLEKKNARSTLQFGKATADAVLQQLSKPQWDKWQQLTADGLDPLVEIKVQ